MNDSASRKGSIMNGEEMIYGVKIEEMERHSYTLSTRSTANFVVFWENNKLTPASFNSACHAPLGYGRSRGGCMVLTKIIDYKDHKKNYYEWLTQRSPYSSACLIKDIDWVIEYGVLSDGKCVPAPLFQSLNIATRRGWEYELAIKFWNMLVANGWSEDFAFIATHVIKPKLDLKQVYIEGTGGHSVFNYGDIKGEITRRFLAHDHNTDLLSWHESGSYRGVHKLYGQECENVCRPLAHLLKDLGKVNISDNRKTPFSQKQVSMFINYTENIGKDYFSTQSVLENEEAIKGVFL